MNDMKHFRLTSLGWMIALLALLGTSELSAKKVSEVVILHTNDTHSAIMPLSPLLQNRQLSNRGGFLRRIAMIEEERAKVPSLLLFDSGDFSQGSAYYTYFKGEVEVKLMNRMGYDAVTLGNHEFDYGLDNLARLVRMAEFPVVCSNYDFTNTPLHGLVKRYVVLKRNGRRIGVFGLSPKPEGLIQQSNYAGMTFLDPIATAKEMIPLLREKERCDLVICLSHLGWNLGREIDDNLLISSTSGIDLLLGGHTHTYMEELEWANDASSRRVAVDQNGKSGIYVGRMVLKPIKLSLHERKMTGKL